MKSIVSFSALGLAVATLASAAIPTPTPPPSNGPFTSCAAGSTDLNVTSFVLSPSPPCPGKELCVVANGTLSQPIIAGGTITFIGRWLSKIVYAYSGNAMDGLVAQGYPNPVPVTTKSIKYCYTMQNSVPIGIPFKWTVQMTNGNGHYLFAQCAWVTPETTNC